VPISGAQTVEWGAKARINSPSVMRTSTTRINQWVNTAVFVRNEVVSGVARATRRATSTDRRNGVDARSHEVSAADIICTSPSFNGRFTRPW
jgi:hypothetical protein